MVVPENMDTANISEASEATQRAAGMVCYAPKMILTKGVWEDENPLDYSVPLFIVQLLVVICLSRVIHLVFKPFRQPKALSQILVRLCVFEMFCFLSTRGYKASQKVMHRNVMTVGSMDDTFKRITYVMPIGVAAQLPYCLLAFHLGVIIKRDFHMILFSYKDYRTNSKRYK